MTGAETLDIARDAIWTIVLVSSPLMVVGLIVGVVVSLVQALTQIQEQTLIFVPKILAIFVTLLLALPFMADALQGHMMRISSRIIGGGCRVRPPHRCIHFPAFPRSSPLPPRVSPPRRPGGASCGRRPGRR